MGRLVALSRHRLEIEKARVKRGPVQGGRAHLRRDELGDGALLEWRQWGGTCRFATLAQRHRRETACHSSIAPRPASLMR